MWFNVHSLLSWKDPSQTFRRDTPASELLRRPIDIFRTCDYQIRDPFHLNKYSKQLDLLITKIILISTSIQSVQNYPTIIHPQ